MKLPESERKTKIKMPVLVEKAKIEAKEHIETFHPNQVINDTAGAWFNWCATCPTCLQFQKEIARWS